jgi:hypothetical protein
MDSVNPDLQLLAILCIVNLMEAMRGNQTFYSLNRFGIIVLQVPNLTSIEYIDEFIIISLYKTQSDVLWNELLKIILQLIDNTYMRSANGLSTSTKYCAIGYRLFSTFTTRHSSYHRNNPSDSPVAVTEPIAVTNPSVVLCMVLLTLIIQLLSETAVDKNISGGRSNTGNF